MSWTIDRAIEEFFLDRRSQGLSEHTKAAYRNDFDRLLEALADSGSLKVSKLDRRRLRMGFGDLADHYSPATVLRTWSTWNQLFSFLVAEEQIDGNPMAAIKKPKPRRPEPKRISGDDSIPRLLAAAREGHHSARDPWPELEWALIVTLIGLGLRLSEVIGLNVGSITGPADDRVITVSGKGSKQRTLPLEPEVEQAINEYLRSREARFPKRKIGARSALFVGRDGKRIGRGAVQYLVKRLYDDAGISGRVEPGALVHALRHTYATNLASAGASAPELQELLGHESLTTTQRYISATARERREAQRSNSALRQIAEIS